MMEAERAMVSVMPRSSVFRVARIGCHEVKSTSKHWVCLFPQHGPGRKHERLIELESWQHAIVAADDFEAMLGNPQAQKHMGHAAAIAGNFDPHLYSVISVHHR